jgi:hypothetical protein
MVAYHVQLRSRIERLLHIVAEIDMAGRPNQEHSSLDFWAVLPEDTVQCLLLPLGSRSRF